MPVNESVLPYHHKIDKQMPNRVKSRWACLVLSVGHIRWYRGGWGKFKALGMWHYNWWDLHIIFDDTHTKLDEVINEHWRQVQVTVHYSQISIVPRSFSFEHSTLLCYYSTLRTLICYPIAIHASFLLGFTFYTWDEPSHEHHIFHLARSVPLIFLDPGTQIILLEWGF